MKKILSIAVIIISMQASAQVSKVSLQASGLTCSMCSNSINKALKTIDFVDKIEPNLKTYTFNITFKENTSIDFDLIRKKVEDAGFFVATFVATVQFNHAELHENQVRLADQTFIFLNDKVSHLNGIKQVKIVDRGFVSSREYKRNTLYTSSNKIYHAILQPS